jgi:hypothetical protein
LKARFIMVAASRSKNLRGSRDKADPLPPSKRVSVLEQENAALRKELRIQKAGFIADLRVALGSSTPRERDGDVERLADQRKFPDQALNLLRGDLLRALATLTNHLAPPGTEAAREGDSRYVA